MRNEELKNYLSSSRCSGRANAQSCLFHVFRNAAILVFTLLAFCSSAFSDDFSEPENVFSEDVFFESEENNKNIKYEEPASETIFFSFSVEPLFGVKIGQVDEYVFLNNCAYDDDKLSELNWEIKPEYFAGIKLAGGIQNVFLETSFSFGFSGKTGKMLDSDWQNILFQNKEDKLYKTNYSESDNYLDHDFSFDFKVGYDFRFAEENPVQFSLKPFAAFQYKNIKFDGKSGTAWYGKGMNYDSATKNYEYYAAYDDEENRTITQFSGKVISYERWSYITWLGFYAGVDFGKHFSVGTGFKVSPYLYSESLDNHHLTYTDYLDKTPGFFKAFNWNLGFAFKINEKHAILLNGEYFLMSMTRGDDCVKSVYENVFVKDSSADGGAAERSLNISLSYKLSL